LKRRPYVYLFYFTRAATAPNNSQSRTFFSSNSQLQGLGIWLCLHFFYHKESHASNLFVKYQSTASTGKYSCPCTVSGCRYMVLVWCRCAVVYLHPCTYSSDVRTPAHCWCVRTPCPVCAPHTQCLPTPTPCLSTRAKALCTNAQCCLCAPAQCLCTPAQVLVHPCIGICTPPQMVWLRPCSACAPLQKPYAPLHTSAVGAPLHSACAPLHRDLHPMHNGVCAPLQCLCTPAQRFAPPAQRCVCALVFS
jgi:hypothetical protein